MKNYKIDAVKALADGKYISCDENGVVVWNADAIDLPTVEEIDAKVAELEAFDVANEYAVLRREQYDLLNQDELRYDDMVNGTNDWGVAIEAIKAQFPKPIV